MVTSVGFSVLKTRGEEWFSHTIPFCFHHPCMIPCYPNTDSNMTCHSEREQCHWGLLQASPLCNFGREHNSTMTALRLHALGSTHPGSKPSAPTLAHPQPEPLLYREAPPVTVSPFLYCCTYWLLILIAVVVTVVFFFSIFHFASAAMTSVFPCTIPQTRPTKLARHHPHHSY